MLSEALRLIRVFHGLKQFELAERLGVSKSHVSEIERGAKTPSLDLLEKYAEVLNMPISSIMFFSEEFMGVEQGKKVQPRIAGKAIKLLQFIEEKANDGTAAE